jgi:hypothetical protein
MTSGRALPVLIALAVGACFSSACRGTQVVVGPQTDGALVIVDTDSAVPSLVGRLRVDLYTASDPPRWYDSFDTLLLDPQKWPTSFGVYSADPEQEHTVLVRLRAYPDGGTRDYRGERFQPRVVLTAGINPEDIAASPPPTNPPAPSLLKNGLDMTPTSEPQPGVSIDRLFYVRVRPQTYGAVRVVLRGACTGTMADLFGKATCVDTENARLPVAEEPLDPDTTLPASLQGAFAAATPCAASAPAPTPGLYDDRICVPGGGFIFAQHRATGRRGSP